MFRKVVSSPSHAAMQFTGARCELGSAKATCALQQKACPNQWNWPCNNELKELVQAGFQYLRQPRPHQIARPGPADFWQGLADHTYQRACWGAS